MNAPLDTASLVALLREDLRIAVGCTEVAAAALVVARAREALGQPVDEVHLAVSPGIYKNGARVGLPGTDLRGLEAAAALGAAIGVTDSGLAVLGLADDRALGDARRLLAENRVNLSVPPEAPDGVWLRAEVAAGPDRATAQIIGRHDAIVTVTRNGRTTYSAPEAADDAAPMARMRATPVGTLIDLILISPADDLAFLVEAAETNVAAAEKGLAGPGGRLGKALARRTNGITNTVAPSHRAQVLAGAASEARMSGASVPIMAMTGSGNHGIAALLGVYGLAEDLEAPKERLAAALGIAAAITMAVKAHTGALTAFGGCAVAPATGVAAAGAYLMDGDKDHMVQAMQSVIATFAGMLCDGAKESCAFKVETAVDGAVKMAALALDGAHAEAGKGILGADIDATFANLGRLNDPGMRETEQVVVSIIRDGLRRDHPGVS